MRHLKGGHVYCGPTLNGEKVGAAVLEFANGDKYVGGFKKDTMEGHGVYEFAGHGHYAGQVRWPSTAQFRAAFAHDSRRTAYAEAGELCVSK